MEQLKEQLAPKFKNEASSLDLLLNRCSIMQHKKGSLICDSASYRPYGYFLIEGMAAASEVDIDKNHLHWVGLAGDFFTSTAHTYNVEVQNQDIHLLTDGKIAYIHLVQLREIADKHIAVQRFLHLQQCQRTTFFQLKTLILAQQASQRYAKLCFYFPQIAYRLNNKQLSNFLAIDLKTLYKSKKNLLFNAI